MLLYKGRAFPLVGVTVRHLHLTVADAVTMITEESHHFSGGSMSNRDYSNNNGKKIKSIHLGGKPNIFATLFGCNLKLSEILIVNQYGKNKTS